MSVHLPVHLSDVSEPQPDVLVVPLPDERYRDAHPTPADALVLIEVAVTSLAYDRGSKLRAYARTGVPEYWIVDVLHDRVEIYAEPRGDAYGEKRILGRGDMLAPSAFPDIAFTVDELLPPA